MSGLIGKLCMWWNTPLQLLGPRFQAHQSHLGFVLSPLGPWKTNSSGSMDFVEGVWPSQGSGHVLWADHCSSCPGGKSPTLVVLSSSWQSSWEQRSNRCVQWLRTRLCNQTAWGQLGALGQVGFFCLRDPRLEAEEAGAGCPKKQMGTEKKTQPILSRQRIRKGTTQQDRNFLDDNSSTMAPSTSAKVKWEAQISSLMGQSIQLLHHCRVLRPKL